MIFHLYYNRSSYILVERSEDDAVFFSSMNLAIINAAAAKIDVKIMLGTELVATFEQLQLDYYEECNEWFKENVEESFTESRAILK